MLAFFALGTGFFMRRSGIFSLFVLGVLAGLPSASLGQQFTFDSPALSDTTELSFSLAEADEQVDVDGELDSSRKRSQRKGAGTLVFKDFVAGWRQGSDETSVQTTTSTFESKSSGESAFLGWHFRNLFTSSEDILTVLVGRGLFGEKRIRTERASLIDSTEETDVEVARQYAVIFRLPWLLLAYSRADVEYDYSLIDRYARTNVDDRFEFSFTIRTIGVKLFDDVFRMDYEERKNPGAQGRELRLGSLGQTYASATLDFGVLAIKASRTTNEMELVDFFTMERTEDSVALKIALEDYLTLTFKNTKSSKEEAVLYSEEPVIFETEGDTNEVNFTFKFTLD